jgi:putative MATE family efflux protein
MKDLTQGPIRGHLITMAVPIAAGMLFQTLYLLIDLYFVARLGNAAIAGVASAGNLSFLVLACTQVLGVGTVSLIAQAVGRKDQPGATLAFNQALGLGCGCALACLILGYASVRGVTAAFGSDAATRAAGTTYLHWYLPALALQFLLVAMGSALRGTGIVKPTMVVQMLSVLLNTVLAPVLIGGWVTHHPLGVAGAGLASSIALLTAVVLMAVYFYRLEHYVAVDRRLIPPRWASWRQILAIGLPAGGEFLMMFLVFSFLFWVIKPFGATAQAGFGVGSRVMQAIFLPAMAVAFALAPVVGQNFGARHYARVRGAFRSAAWMSELLMLLAILLCLWRAPALIHFFTSDAAAVQVGADYLRYLAWNLICVGFIFTCSGTLQGLGNTWPSLWSSASRIVTFMLPVLWLSMQPGFAITQIWIVSIASTTLQAVLIGILLLRQLARLPAGSAHLSSS